MANLEPQPQWSPIEREWDRETARLVRTRVPYAALGFLVSLGAVWIIEHRSHPSRDTVYGLVYGFQALVLIATALLVRRRPLSAERNIRMVVLAAVLVAASIATYHIAVAGEAEILALALAYLCVGLMVIIPWGGRGQLIVSIAVVLAFVVAVRAGVQASTPASINLIGLLFICSLTVPCALALERYRRNTYWQAAELRHANAELQRANDALAAADEAKTQFLATLSHELRTPISIVIGYADLLDEGVFGELTPEAHEIIGRIRTNSHMLVNLTNDLLDLSRVQANKLDLRLARTSLAPVCAEAVAFVQPLLRDRPVTLSVSVGEGIDVHADPQRLRQVLVNLLTNATKFTERGHISLRGFAIDQTTVAVEVADSGIGIPADELESIFEPFHRGRQAAQINGAGIGLALSRRLTEAMSGSLTVASVVGLGSTFTVRLPRAEAGGQGRETGNGKRETITEADPLDSSGAEYSTTEFQVVPSPV